MAARFGDMLLEQRRRMGLSIQQVANTIKIRPQIIEFFETGNFASMPPRGYAQGMISSYARFLGRPPTSTVISSSAFLRRNFNTSSRIFFAISAALSVVSFKISSWTLSSP